MRLAVASETGESRRIDPEKIKKLTGNETIPVRLMRPDFFEFRPTHDLWLLSNYKPKAPANEDALWGWVKLIPFVVKFEEREDATLPTSRSIAAKRVSMVLPCDDCPPAVADLARRHRVRVPSLMVRCLAEG